MTIILFQGIEPKILSLAKAVSKKRYRDDRVVPTNCVKGVFTTGTTDNIDESGRIEMHGTSITLIGHPSSAKSGEKRPLLDLNVDDNEPVMLPEDFANVPFVEDFGGDVKLEPIPSGAGTPANEAQTLSPEESWLTHFRQSRVKDDDSKWTLGKIPVTFSGYFSNKQKQEEVKPRAIIGTVPVFTEEKADSLSMQNTP